MILHRADGRSNRIFHELLALRQEFAPFREKYYDYQKVVRNKTDLTIAELLDARTQAVHEVSESLKAIGKSKSDSRLISEVFSTSVKGDGTSSTAATSISLNSLMQLAVRKVKAWRVRGRARALFDLQKKLSEVKGYGSLVARTFQLDVTPDEVKQLQAFHNATKAMYGDTPKPTK